MVSGTALFFHYYLAFGLLYFVRMSQDNYLFWLCRQFCFSTSAFSAREEENRLVTALKLAGPVPTHADITGDISVISVRLSVRLFRQCKMYWSVLVFWSSTLTRRGIRDNQMAVCFVTT